MQLQQLDARARLVEVRERGAGRSFRVSRKPLRGQCEVSLAVVEEQPVRPRVDLVDVAAEKEIEIAVVIDVAERCGDRRVSGICERLILVNREVPVAVVAVEHAVLDRRRLQLARAHDIAVGDE